VNDSYLDLIYVCLCTDHRFYQLLSTTYSLCTRMYYSQPAGFTLEKLNPDFGFSVWVQKAPTICLFEIGTYFLAERCNCIANVRRLSVCDVRVL